MTWQETKEIAAKSLTEILQELTEINADSLARTTELGTELDFSDGVPLFRQTVSLLRRLRESDLSLLPTERIEELTTACTQIRDQFQEIRDFTPHRSNPAAARDSYISEVDSILNTHFPLLTTVVAFSGQDEAVIRGKREEVAKIVDSVTKLQKEADNRVKATNESSKRILDQAKRTAASVGISTHAEHFQKEADRHRRSGRGWLIATIALASIAGVISWWTISESLSGSSEWFAVMQMTLARLSLMALTYSVAIWSSRMYRAARHNEVVNRHRVNAMRTFETFTAAGRDDAIKDAILMRATECIFHHQSSGFSDRTPEQGSSKIVNTLPTAAPGSGTGQSHATPPHAES